MSASTSEPLTIRERLFDGSPVTPAEPDGQSAKVKQSLGRWNRILGRGATSTAPRTAA